MQNVLCDIARLTDNITRLTDNITDIKHDIEFLPKAHEVNQISGRVESLERTVSDLCDICKRVTKIMGVYADHMDLEI